MQHFPSSNPTVKKEIGTHKTFWNNLETFMQSSLTWHPSSSLKFAFFPFLLDFEEMTLFLLVK